MEIHLPKIMRQWFRDEIDYSGWDGLLERLNLLTKLDLYQVSTEWAQPASGYLMKAKGAKGDLLVIFDQP